MSQLTLIVPGLAQLNPEYNKTLPELEGLSTLLLRAKKSNHTDNYSQSLFAAMGLKAEFQPSIAALTAIADEADFEEAYCLRVDPVELRADLTAVYMYGNQHLSVDEKQCERVKELVQPLLTEYGMTLHTSITRRWYLSMNQKPKLLSYEPNSIVGKDILNYLPEGMVPINWKMLQTEIQMVLHEVAEIAPINSLWIWGDGNELPEKFELPYKIVIADEALAQGLAQYLKFDLKNLSDSSLTDIHLSCDNKADIILVYEKFQALDSHAAWLHQLIKFEQCVVSILLNALKQKSITKILLQPLNGWQYELSRNNLFHFWKRTKNFKEELCKKPL
jgi:hypothetical protein